MIGVLYSTNSNSSNEHNDSTIMVAAIHTPAIARAICSKTVFGMQTGGAQQLYIT